MRLERITNTDVVAAFDAGLIRQAAPTSNGLGVGDLRFNRFRYTVDDWYSFD